MITRPLIRRIVGWTVALSSVMAPALAGSASASATTHAAGVRVHQADFTCQDLSWVEEGVLEGTGCSPEHVGPIVDPFVVEGPMNGVQVAFSCESGFGVVDTIRAFDCAQTEQEDD